MPIYLAPVNTRRPREAIQSSLHMREALSRHFKSPPIPLRAAEIRSIRHNSYSRLSFDRFPIPLSRHH